ncbi:MAG TPA: hypothetical protein VGK44_11440, partial [Casimicrobiaceae bacterium]
GRALPVRARRVHAEMQSARAELAALAQKGNRNAPIFGLLTPERRVRLRCAHRTASYAIGDREPRHHAAGGQPPVRELEDSIGVALFERTARGMMPARASVAVALRLKRALAEIRHAVADIAALRGTSRAR